MLGEAFKIVRVFNGLTQQELAADLGVSHSFLSQIESGKRNPTLATVEAFSQRFRIPVSSLMFFSEQLTSGESDRDGNSRIRFGRKVLGALMRVTEAAE